ncbi:unnamed protein product [Diatraea saccharalis]|uniref:Uncharacterized protein n=1 Tax=Diatraea saccharalis TaxID=40085 RepID=A0A9P0C4K4_9NEOP|nr:unnamed protein product [Diatraea saccharalis]
MHNIKELEENLFGHLKDDRLSITKRRKILRRLERKKERILANAFPIPSTIDLDSQPTVNRSGSLWDVRVMPPKTTETQTPLHKYRKNVCLIGPKKQTMYTIKDNKIVRLEPLNDQGEVKTVDIVMPVNSAEAQLLEGTKMSLDNIKKIDRFRDYDPGIPSKVLIFFSILFCTFFFFLFIWVKQTVAK